MRVKQKFEFFIDNFDIHAFAIFLIALPIALFLSSHPTVYKNFVSSWYAPPACYAALLALVCSMLFGDSSETKKYRVKVSLIFYSILAIFFYFLFNFYWKTKLANDIFFFTGIGIYIFLFVVVPILSKLTE